MRGYRTKIPLCGDSETGYSCRCESKISRFTDWFALVKSNVDEGKEVSI